MLMRRPQVNVEGTSTGHAGDLRLIFPYILCHAYGPGPYEEMPDRGEVNTARVGEDFGGRAIGALPRTPRFSAVRRNGREGRR